MKAIHRLFQYIENKGIRPTRLEKETGLSNGYLGTQLKREADLGEGVMNKIINYCLDISPEWLLTGNGPMLRDGRPAEAPNPSTEPPDAGREATIYKELLAEQKADYEKKVTARDEEIKKLNKQLGAMEEKLSARTQTAPSAFFGTAHPGMPVLFDPAGPPDDGTLASDVTPATKPPRGQTVVRN